MQVSALCRLSFMQVSALCRRMPCAGTALCRFFIVNLYARAACQALDCIPRKAFPQAQVFMVHLHCLVHLLFGHLLVNVLIAQVASSIPSAKSSILLFAKCSTLLRFARSTSAILRADRRASRSAPSSLSLPSCAFMSCNIRS